LLLYCVSLYFLSFPTRRSSDLNAPASGLNRHTFSVHPAMKPNARSGLQAVGSLWLMDTCLVVVAVPPGVTAVNVTSYSPSNVNRSEEHTSELQSRENLVCRLLL